MPAILTVDAIHMDSIQKQSAGTEFNEDVICLVC